MFLGDRLADGGEALLRGGIVEAAGIDQHHVRLVVIGRQRIAVAPELGQDAFGIDQRLGAAERNHADFRRRRERRYHEWRPNRGRRGIFLERSEEHTSELQSLMRISYAVFCLNKKKNNK